MQARIDQNDRKTALGVSSVDSVTPVRLRVDPVTSYLLIKIVATSSGVVNTVHRIDQNDIPTCYGWNGTQLVPVATDNNGYLLVQSN